MRWIRCKIHLDQNIQSNVCHFLEIFSISTTVFPIQNAVLCFRWFCCVPFFVWGILTSDHEHSMELTYPTKQEKENPLQISLGWGYVSSQQGRYLCWNFQPPKDFHKQTSLTRFFPVTFLGGLSDLFRGYVTSIWATKKGHSKEEADS